MTRLVAIRLKSYFQLNPIIITLLLLGGLFSIILGAYSYGNLMPWPSAESPMKLHNRYFSLRPADSATVKDAENLFQVICEKTKVYNFDVCLDIQQKEVAFTLENGAPVLIHFILGERRFNLIKRFDDSLREEGAYLPSSTVLNAQGTKVEPGDSFLLAGKSTKFIGQMNTSEIYLSENYSVPETQTVSSLTFLTQRVLSSPEVQALMDGTMFDSRFHFVVTPLNFREVDKEALPVRFLMICAVLVLSIISYCFLIRYLIDLQWKNNTILFLLGFSARRLRHFILLELFIYSFVSAVIGLAIYLPLYKYYLQSRMLFDVVKYYYYDNFLILILYVALTFMISLPFIFVRIKSTNIEALWQEGELA